MAIPVSTTLGVNLAYLSPTLSRTVPVGTVIKATDGHDYIFAKASAAIASAAVCILTEPAMTMATGSGAWTAPTITGGVPINNYAWFQKTLP
jgi:hypothetical protein